ETHARHEKRSTKRTRFRRLRLPGPSEKSVDIRFAGSIERDRAAVAAVAVADFHGGENEIRVFRQITDVRQELYADATFRSHGPIRHHGPFGIDTSQRWAGGGDAADPLLRKVDHRLGPRRRPAFALAIKRIGHAGCSFGHRFEVFVHMTAVKDN